VLAYNKGGDGPHTDVLRVSTMAGALSRMGSLQRHATGKVYVERKQDGV
jgi:hypothetical protein